MTNVAPYYSIFVLQSWAKVSNTWEWRVSGLCHRWPVGTAGGPVPKKETIKKQDHCEPCEGLPVFENRSVSFFFVRSHVSGKVKEKIWGQKKVIFSIRSVGELSSWRQMAGWALVPPIDATVQLTRSEVKSRLTAVVRQGGAVCWSELKAKHPNRIISTDREGNIYIYFKSNQNVFWSW